MASDGPLVAHAVQGTGDASVPFVDVIDALEDPRHRRRRLRDPVHHTHDIATSHQSSGEQFVISGALSIGGDEHHHRKWTVAGHLRFHAFLEGWIVQLDLKPRLQGQLHRSDGVVRAGVRDSLVVLGRRQGMRNGAEHEQAQHSDRQPSPHGPFVGHADVESWPGLHRLTLH